MLMSHMRMVAFTWPFSFLSDVSVLSAVHSHHLACVYWQSWIMFKVSVWLGWIVIF